MRTPFFRRLGLAPLAVLTAAKPRRDLGPAIVLLLVLTVIVIAPSVYRGDALHQQLSASLSSPTLRMPLGTDQFGRDELARILLGTQRSVFASIAVVTIVFSIGLLVGSTIAATPRVVRRVLSGVVDIGLGIPSIVIGIVVVGVLGPGTQNTVVALSVLGWCWYARLAEEHAAELLSGRVVAVARVSGVRPLRYVWGHVIPHVARRLFVLACLDVGYVILMIAGLSYLGLGDQEPAPELGQMLHLSQTYVMDAPWLIVGPVLAIALVVLPFVAVGESAHARVLRS